MKRGGPIARRTPLRNQSPMRRTRRESTATPNPPRRRKMKRPPMDGGLRATIYERARGLCDLHGGHIDPDAWDCHHRQLRSRGGPDTPGNLVALCPGCHTWVHGNPAAATAIGFMVPSWADPDHIPIHRWRQTWCQPVAGRFTHATPIEGANT